MTLLKKPSAYRGHAGHKSRKPHKKLAAQRRKEKFAEENTAYKTAMYKTKLELSHTQSKCPVCLLPLGGIGDGHHVLVRRGSYPKELLYVTQNVRLLHHKCHMERGSFNTHAIAMILKDYELLDLAEWLDGLGVTGDVWDVVTGELWRVHKLRKEESSRECPACGQRTLHAVSDGKTVRRGFAGVVCWNCWETQGVSGL